MSEKSKIKSWPEESGCLECGTREKPPFAKGLCATCYRRLWKESRTIEATSQPKEESSSLDEFPDSRPSSPLDPDNLEPEPIKDPSLIDRAKNLFHGKPSQPEITFQTKEKRPKGSGRRTSAAEFLADGYYMLGGLVRENPNHQPLGKMLQWQSGTSGQLLDDALSGTIIDKFAVQKLVKTKGRLDVLGAVIGPPAIVFMIEKYPQRAPELLRMLERTLRSALPQMAGAIIKVRDREAKNAAAVAALFPEEAAAGIDPIEKLMQELFGDYFQFTENSSEENNQQ